MYSKRHNNAINSDSRKRHSLVVLAIVIKSKEGPLAGVKDDLVRYRKEAERGEIVITRHGKPAGVLFGFKSEEDWFDYRLDNDPRFLDRVVKTRESLHTPALAAART